MDVEGLELHFLLLEGAHEVHQTLVGKLRTGQVQLCDFRKNWLQSQDTVLPKVVIGQVQAI